MGEDGQSQAPVALPPGKRPGTHFIGGWVGTRAGLNECGKRHGARFIGGCVGTRAGLNECGKRPGTHFIGGWVGTRAGLNECGKSRPPKDSITGSFSP